MFNADTLSNLFWLRSTHGQSIHLAKVTLEVVSDILDTLVCSDIRDEEKVNLCFDMVVLVKGWTDTPGFQSERW